jgi:hypothetical protein
MLTAGGDLFGNRAPGNGERENHHFYDAHANPPSEAIEPHERTLLRRKRVFWAETPQKMRGHAAPRGARVALSAPGFFGGRIFCGKPVPTLGSSPRAGIFRKMLWAREKRRFVMAITHCPTAIR